MVEMLIFVVILRIIVLFGLLYCPVSIFRRRTKSALELIFFVNFSLFTKTLSLFVWYLYNFRSFGHFTVLIFRTPLAISFFPSSSSSVLVQL